MRSGHRPTPATLADAVAAFIAAFSRAIEVGKQQGTPRRKHKHLRTADGFRGRCRPKRIFKHAYALGGDKYLHASRTGL